MMTRDKESEHGVTNGMRPEPEVGTFFVLPHEDNHPGEQDETFQKNVEVAKGFQDNLKYGCEVSKGEVTEFKQILKT